MKVRSFDYKRTMFIQFRSGREKWAASFRQFVGVGESVTRYVGQVRDYFTSKQWMSQTETPKPWVSADDGGVKASPYAYQVPASSKGSVFVGEDDDNAWEHTPEMEHLALTEGFCREVPVNERHRF